MLQLLNDDEGGKVYQGFHSKIFENEVKNLEAKKERELNLISKEMEIRCKDNDKFTT